MQGHGGVDEGSASVHGHGDAPSLDNFLFGGAGLEGRTGVEGDAVVATRSDGHTDRNELAHFFAKKGAFGIRDGKWEMRVEVYA